MTPEPEELQVEAFGSKLAAKGGNLTVTVLIVALALSLSYINYNGFADIKTAIGRSSTEHVNIVRSFEISVCLNYLETAKPEVYRNLSVDAGLMSLKIQCPWMTTHKKKNENNN